MQVIITMIILIEKVGFGTSLRNLKIVIDIECNSLNNPTKIWCIVCKDIDNNHFYILRGDNQKEFLEFAKSVDTWIGHSFIGYDYPVLNKLLGLGVPAVADKCIDTLIVSQLVDYSRVGRHSIEQYGKEFGLEKITFS